MSPEDLVKAAQDTPPELMREMSRVALREATEALAKQADAMAGNPRIAWMSGPDALRAFARAIRANNVKVWGGSA